VAGGPYRSGRRLPDLLGGGLDLDLPRTDSLGLRDVERQDAMLEGGINPLALDGHGERQLPAEGPSYTGLLLRVERSWIGRPHRLRDGERFVEATLGLEAQRQGLALPDEDVADQTRPVVERAASG
jgi:hypothetical protein